MEDKGMGFALISLVAIVGIVAVVGLLTMFTGRSQSAAYGTQSVLSADASGAANTAGDARLTRQQDYSYNGDNSGNCGSASCKGKKANDACGDGGWCQKSNGCLYCTA